MSNSKKKGFVASVKEVLKASGNQAEVDLGKAVGTAGANVIGGVTHLGVDKISNAATRVTDSITKDTSKPFVYGNRGGVTPVGYMLPNDASYNVGREDYLETDETKGLPKPNQESYEIVKYGVVGLVCLIVTIIAVRNV